MSTPELDEQIREAESRVPALVARLKSESGFTLRRALISDERLASDAGLDRARRRRQSADRFEAAVRAGREEEAYQAVDAMMPQLPELEALGHLLYALPFLLGVKCVWNLTGEAWTDTAGAQDVLGNLLGDLGSRLLNAVESVPADVRKAPDQGAA